MTVLSVFSRLGMIIYTDTCTYLMFASGALFEFFLLCPVVFQIGSLSSLCTP